MALSDLVHRYAAGVDERRFASVAELFTEDADLFLPDPPATLEPIRRHHGRAAIGEAVGAVASTIRTRHAVVGEVYDPDVATGFVVGRIACVAHHWVRHDDQIRDVTWHVRYQDVYLRSGSAAWRIARRALTIDAIDIRPTRVVRPAGPHLSGVNPSGPALPRLRADRRPE